jgi:drug/metabolite transporter (DMT)-like permease
MEKSTLHGFLFLFIGIFFWATIELTIKLIQWNSTPITINFFRMLFGSIALLGYIFISKKTKSLWNFVRYYKVYYLTAALLGLAIGLTIYTFGTSLTQASIAATIFSANPIIIAIYMIGVQKEQRSGKKISGIILGFIGVVIVITQLQFDSLFTTENFLGNILVFLGMSLWCIHVIVGNLLLRKKIGPKLDGNAVLPVTNADYNGVTFLMSSVMMVPLLFLPNQISAIAGFTLSTWLGLMYLGFIAGGIGYICFFKGLSLMEASRGINAFYFKPIIATLLSIVLLGESPGWSLYLGIVIEFIAIYFITRS